MTTLAILLALMGQPAEPALPATVPSVDLQRYAGRWFEIARLPNRFQRDCAGDVVAFYAPRPDGKIDVENRCRKADGSANQVKGIARRAQEDDNTRLEVRFAPAWLSWLPSVWGDYWILGLDQDYRYAVVGSPDRKYLWLLARDANPSQAEFDRMQDIAERQGFDVARLERTKQSGEVPGEGSR